MTHTVAALLPNSGAHLSPRDANDLTALENMKAATENLGLGGVGIAELRSSPKPRYASYGLQLNRHRLLQNLKWLCLGAGIGWLLSVLAAPLYVG